jgi:hypothetical protein
MADVFLAAARHKFRFQTDTSLGEVTTEQLFGLPLTSATNKAKKSFVSDETNPQRPLLEAKLAVVKGVIEVIQDERKKEQDAVAKKAQRTKLDEAIEAAEHRELGGKSVEELKAMRAAL